MNDKEQQSRRDFLKSSALTAAGLSLGLPAISSILPESANHQISLISKSEKSLGERSINLFSKPLQFMSVPAMAAVLKPMGFNGIDLTIRPDGHVVPEKAVVDLPIALAAIRKAGLEVPMVVTNISSNSALNESIIKTLANLGIRQYRMAFFSFDPQLGVEKSLDKFKKQFKELSLLNKKYGVKGAYQNHSGVRLGGSVWDLWYTMKDLDPRWIGIQYDPKHASMEGQQSWIHSFELVKDFVHSINVKDMYWEKKKTTWGQVQAPLGEGMTDFSKFFNIVKQYNLNVPISLHLEYPMGGAEDGNKTITIPESQIFGYIKRDLLTLKKMLSSAGLS